MDSKKVENRHSYPNIHLLASHDSSVSTGTHSRQDNQSFVTGSKGFLSFLLHPDHLWYLSVCLRQMVGTQETLPPGQVVAGYMSG